jgi:hypothetical protein
MSDDSLIDRQSAARVRDTAEVPPAEHRFRTPEAFQRMGASLEERRVTIG